MSRTVKIEVEVPEFDISDADALRAAVIAAYVSKYETALAHAVSGMKRDSDDDFSDDPRRLHAAMVGAAREQVLSTIRERVDEAVSSVVGSVFMPTDRWGHKAGEPMTLKDLAAKTAEQWFAEKVDANGNRDTYGRSESLTRAAWIARKAAEDVFSGTLKSAVDSIKAEIAASLKSRVADEIAGHVAKLFGGGK